MLRCVLRGDAAGALRWRRVEQALEAEEAEMRRYLCQEEALNSLRLGEEADGGDWLRPTPGPGRGPFAAADADSADSDTTTFGADSADSDTTNFPDWKA